MDAESPSRVVHVPAEWAQAAERIEREAIRKVVVIGATDVGKSTFCRFLLDQASRSGTSAALLDADPGQKTTGPPACVTLDDSHGLRLAFVGTTDPVAGWHPLIDGISRLARQADAALLVVNTSGLLTGPGRRLKAAEIEAVQPDLLVALGEEPDVEAIANAHRAIPHLRLAPSPEARRKTKGERRRIRREAFRRYFANSSTLVLDCRLLQTLRPDEPLPEGLLLGLGDTRGDDIGLGILAECSGGRTLAIRTPVAAERIGRIVPGHFSLDGSFSEIHPKAVVEN